LSALRPSRPLIGVFNRPNLLWVVAKCLVIRLFGVILDRTACVRKSAVDWIKVLFWIGIGERVKSGL
jgi:hypothetical protein